MAMFKCRRISPNGFTLIELLVTISIIAILVGLLLPALGAVRRQGRAIGCLSNIRQIAMAGMMYADEHGRYVGWHADIDRKQLLYPYLRQGESNADTDGDQVWHCPSNQRLDEEASYGFNTLLNWVKLVSVRQPTATVALTDAGVNDDLQPTLATHVFPPSATSFANIGRPNPRHPGGGDRGVNVGFVDGHAESVVMEPPFYPDVPGVWRGNGETDPDAAEYKDQLWDLN